MMYPLIRCKSQSRGLEGCVVAAAAEVDVSRSRSYCGDRQGFGCQHFYAPDMCYPLLDDGVVLELGWFL